MRKKILTPLLIIIAMLSSGVAHTAPARPALSQLVGQADAIVVANITNVGSNYFNEISQSVAMDLEVSENLKGDAPANFHLAFLVFPGSYENHLREPITPGKYIVLLQEKAVQGANGHRGRALTLIEPRVFAFMEYDEETLRNLQLYVSE